MGGRARPGRHLAGLGELWDVRAHAVAAVAPAVIGADELAAPHAAERERGAPVHAEIVEGVRDAGGIAPQHERPAEEVGRSGSIAHVGGIGHGVPALAEGAHAGESTGPRDDADPGAARPRRRVTLAIRGPSR
jgi:hypothetical protein